MEIRNHLLYINNPYSSSSLHTPALSMQYVMEGSDSIYVLVFIFNVPITVVSVVSAGSRSVISQVSSYDTEIHTVFPITPVSLYSAVYLDCVMCVSMKEIDPVCGLKPSEALVTVVWVHAI